MDNHSVEVASRIWYAVIAIMVVIIVDTSMEIFNAFK